MTDHHDAIGAGHILYGEANFGGTHASAVLPQANGANVFIRQSKKEVASVPSAAAASIEQAESEESECSPGRQLFEPSLSLALALLGKALVGSAYEPDQGTF